MNPISKLTLVAAASAAFATSPALAQNDKAPSASIEIGDLDLNTQSDRDTLDHRVTQAIRSLCNIEDRSTAARRRATECRLAARASAQPQVRMAILDAKGTTLALNAEASDASAPRG